MRGAVEAVAGSGHCPPGRRSRPACHGMCKFTPRLATRLHLGPSPPGEKSGPATRVAFGPDNPSQLAGGAPRRGARRGVENRAGSGPVCLDAIQSRTPSPEDVLRGAVRVPPAGGADPAGPKAIRRTEGAVTAAPGPTRSPPP
jgi:hypothetical protein